MINRYQEKAVAELQITLVDGNKFGMAAMQTVILVIKECIMWK